MKRKVLTKQREASPEVILKQFVHFDCTGRKIKPEPALLILANREGYAWLADYFGALATREWHTSSDISDPDDHQHLRDALPINRKLSDTMEIRLGFLNEQNRRAVKQKYNISTSTARHDSLVRRYKMFIDWAKRQISMP
jgi:hypothetical protein